MNAKTATTDPAAEPTAAPLFQFSDDDLKILRDAFPEKLKVYMADTLAFWRELPKLLGVGKLRAVVLLKVASHNHALVAWLEAHGRRAQEGFEDRERFGAAGHRLLVLTAEPGDLVIERGRGRGAVLHWDPT